MRALVGGYMQRDAWCDWQRSSPHFAIRKRPLDNAASTCLSRGSCLYWTKCKDVVPKVR
jgi:hypothetical protein